MLSKFNRDPCSGRLFDKPILRKVASHNSDMKLAGEMVRGRRHIKSQRACRLPYWRPKALCSFPQGPLNIEPLHERVPRKRAC